MVIAFVTFFLGLVSGHQVVQVTVGQGVSTVEIHVDGERLAIFDGEPWATGFDFGDELVPRHLEAVAFDDTGRELGRAEQWLNLSQAAAEVHVVLDPHVEGQERHATLSWESTISGEPLSVEASFDGQPLELVGGRRLVLPPHDLASLHFLRVVMDFGEGVKPVEELAFGGTYGEEVSTELTAIPILAAADRKPPTVEELQGLLLRRGRPLRVTAVDRGTAEINFLKNQYYRARFEPANATLRWKVTMPRKMLLRFLSTVPERHQGVSTNFALFKTSRDFTTGDGGFYFLASRFRWKDEDLMNQRLNDAVAVAGLKSFNSHSRRAVVLLLHGDLPEQSHASAAAVRRYLRRLHVPLFVWSPDAKPPASHAAWGEARDVMTVPLFRRAAEEVFDHLDRQWVVWVDGRHVPQEIVLAQGEHGFSLVSNDLGQPMR